MYELANRGSLYFELDVEGTSMETMARHLQMLLELATSKSDFSEILSPHRTFCV